jgi:hypothetical protein
MTCALIPDLRRPGIGAIEEGLPTRSAARRFSIGISTARPVPRRPADDPRVDVGIGIGGKVSPAPVVGHHDIDVRRVAAKAGDDVRCALGLLDAVEEARNHCGITIGWCCMGHRLSPLQVRFRSAGPIAHHR